MAEVVNNPEGAVGGGFGFSSLSLSLNLQKQHPVGKLLFVALNDFPAENGATSSHCAKDIGPYLVKENHLSEESMTLKRNGLLRQVLFKLVCD